MEGGGRKETNQNKADKTRQDKTRTDLPQNPSTLLVTSSFSLLPRWGGEGT